MLLDFYSSPETTAHDRISKLTNEGFLIAEKASNGYHYAAIKAQWKGDFVENVDSIGLNTRWSIKRIPRRDPFDEAYVRTPKDERTIPQHCGEGSRKHKT